MLKLIEKIFSVAMLVYTTGAIMPILLIGNYPYPGMFGNRFALAVQTAFYAGLFCLIAIEWQSFLQTAWKVKWIGALLAVAFLSTAWSQDPLFTLRRAIVLLATTAFGIYLGSRFDIPEQLRLLAWTFGIVICASFLCVLLLPHYGLDHLYHEGDWQGVFSHKNSLGRAMVLSAIVFFFVKFRSGSTLRWMGIAGSLTLLVLSRSITGIIVFAIILASRPFYRLFRMKFTFALPLTGAIFAFLAAAAAAGYKALPTMLEMLNRDSGLTGRTELWDAIWISISNRPWLGYGFDAFWRGLQGESAMVIQAVGWTPLGAHNGFLALLLDIGILGLAVFVFGYIVLWYRALEFVTRVAGTIPIWLCTYLLFMLVYNFTESAILVQNNIFWVLYTSTAVNLYLDLPAKTASEQVSWNISSSHSNESLFPEQPSCA